MNFKTRLFTSETKHRTEDIYTRTADVRTQLEGNVGGVAAQHHKMHRKDNKDTAFDRPTKTFHSLKSWL